jgi:hypothetical protein
MSGRVLVMGSISPMERLLEVGGIATRGTLLRSCERVATSTPRSATPTSTEESWPRRTWRTA